MFTSVQPNQQNQSLKGKNGLLHAGMGLAKRERMIKRFTHKELTLIIGIVVALVIVFAVWSNKSTGRESAVPTIKPKIGVHSMNDLAKKAVTMILAITPH